MTDGAKLASLDDAGEFDVFDGTEFPKPAAVHDPTSIPYLRIWPPDDTPYTEFNTYQRRAIIARRVDEAGTFDRLAQSMSELAEEFDCSKATIHRDKQILCRYLRTGLGDDDAILWADAVIKNAVAELEEAGDHYEAGKLVREWYQTFADMGLLPREPDKIQGQFAHAHHTAGESESYRVIEDDAAEAVSVESEVEDS